MLRSSAVSSPSALHFRQVRPRQSLGSAAELVLDPVESGIADLRGVVGVSLLARSTRAMPPFGGIQQSASCGSPPVPATATATPSTGWLGEPLKLVALPSGGEDQFRVLGIRLQLLAQPSDVDINNARISVTSW